MKVLTATGRAQGQRAGDFAWCDEGEIVTCGSCCDSEACGCQRAFIGLVSRKGTTTAAVTEREGCTVTDLAAELLSSHRRAGLLQAGNDTADEVAREAASLARIASGYPAGAVLEIRAGRIRIRYAANSTAQSAAAGALGAP